MTLSPDTIGLHAQLACVWEATARKPGNVHRFRDFSDTGYVDFLASAAAIAPVLADAGNHTVGETILEAVRQTRQVARANTNLGIILLLAPLAKAGPDLGHSSISAVLDELTVEDAVLAYQAIRLAGAGGLGTSAEQDVHDIPTVTLREAMRMAADRDSIARQYVNGFEDVECFGAPEILLGIDRTGCLEGGIIHAYLRLMSVLPDTLIARKRGMAEAKESAWWAAELLADTWPGTPEWRERLAKLNDWLSAEGHQRNPGTTADLIAASLFLLLRQGRLPVPLEVPWTRSELWAV